MPERQLSIAISNTASYEGLPHGVEDESKEEFFDDAVESPAVISTTNSWLDSKPPWESTSGPQSKVCSTAEVSAPKTGINLDNPTLDLLARLVRTTFRPSSVNVSLQVSDSPRDLLGEGSTFRVEKGKLLKPPDNPWVAVKRAKLFSPLSRARKYAMHIEQSRLRSVVTEVEILSHLPLTEHPNIVKLLGFLWDLEDNSLAPRVITELALFGSLNTFMENIKLSDTERQALCLDIILGLEFTHTCMIVHGDVKQENILVFPHPKKRFIAKLSDFEHSILEHDVPIYRGTPVYNAPEVHLQQSSRVSPGKESNAIPWAELPLCDVFSCGLLLFEILCGGRRYHKFLESGTFLKALMSDAADRKNTLSIALAFLAEANPLPPHLIEISQQIFRSTLSHKPRERLRGGWAPIRDILGGNNSVQVQTQTAFPLSVPHRRSRFTYSILEFCHRIYSISRKFLGYALAEELLYAAEKATTHQQRGRIHFELGLLYALGKSPKSVDENGMSWITSSASFGYPASLVLGERIFLANSLPVPAVCAQEPLDGVLRSQIGFLNGLQPNEYYSNATRLLWTKDLQNSAQSLLTDHGLGLIVDEFRGLCAGKLGELGSLRFSKFADDHCLIHHAVLFRDIAAIELLLGSGCFINLLTKHGITPLHLACRCADVSLIYFLLSKGADASLNDAHNIAPLHWLILLPNSDIPAIAGALISNGASTDSSMDYDAVEFYDNLGLILRGTPLTWACSCRNHVAVATLLSFYANTSPHLIHVILLESLATVYADIVELIFTHTDILHILSFEQKQQLYIAIGANFNTYQRWIAHGAAYRRAYTEIMDTLARHNIPFPTNSLIGRGKFPQTLLCRAALSYNIQLAEELLRRGAEVDAPDALRITPLIMCLKSYGCDITNDTRVEQMIRLLIRSGASLEPTDDYYALNEACENALPLSVIRFLIEKGSQVNNMPKQKAPLHLLIAAEEWNNSTVEGIITLVDFGADLNMETVHRDGNVLECCLTPIAVAINNEKWTAVQFLLNKGVNINIGVSGGHQHTIVHLLIFKMFILETKHELEAKRNIISCFESLLDQQYSIGRGDLLNAKNHKSCSPLETTIFLAFPRCAKLLLDRGAETPTRTVELINDLDENPPKDIIYGNESLGVVGRSPSTYRASLKEIGDLIDFADNSRIEEIPWF